MCMCIYANHCGIVRGLLTIFTKTQRCIISSKVSILVVLWVFLVRMAEGMDWDEVTYLKKKPQRAADAKSQKVRGDLLLKRIIHLMYTSSFRLLTRPNGEERESRRRRSVSLRLKIDAHVYISMGLL